MPPNFTHNQCPDLYSTVLFQFSTLIIALISILALMTNILCWKLVNKSGGAIPANVKFMIANCNLVYIIKDFYFLILVIYHILLIEYQFSNVENRFLPINKLSCSIFLYFYMMPTVNVFWSMLLIALDRLYVTIRKNSADVVSRPIKLICIFIWILSSVHHTVPILINSGLNTMSEPVCYCYVTAVWLPAGIKVSTSFVIFIQMVSCSLYALIYYVNKRYLTDFGLNTARHSLSERFVTWSNVKTSMWLLPVSFMHSITFTVALVLVNVAIVGYLSPNGTAGARVQFNTGYVNFVSLYMAWFALESLIHPILCIKYNDFLYNKVLRTNYPSIFNIVSWCSRRQKNSTEPCSLQKSESSIIWRKMDDGRRGPATASTVAPGSPILAAPSDDPFNETSAFLTATVSSTAVIDFDLTATKKEVAAGRKVIVEYRLPPEASQDLLESMWNSVHRP